MNDVAELFTTETLYGVGSSLLRIVVVIAVAWVAVRIARRALGRLTMFLACRMVRR